MNMRIGPMIQLSNKETLRTFVFLKTSFSLSYLTFAKGGYIISIKPIAKGILVVPEENELIKEDDEGIKKPMATPTAIAINIQSVKYLSKKLNFFLSSAGAQLFADIIYFEINSLDFESGLDWLINWLMELETSYILDPQLCLMKHLLSMAINKFL